MMDVFKARKTRVLKALTFFVAALAVVVGVPATAQSYYVRPLIFYGDGAQIDGIKENGATAATQSFSSNGVDLSATADLRNGNVKSYLSVNGPDNYAQVVGTFGDTLSFGSNAIGQMVGLSFDYDGSITAGYSDSVLNSQSVFGYYATLFAYRSGSGVSYADYGDPKYDAFKVIGQSYFRDLGQAAGSVSTFVDESIGGQFTVDSPGSYDLFAGLSLFAATNAQPINITADFSHTGQLGVTTPPGVTFQSASGVLLSGSNVSAVPEPATWAMMLIGIGGAGATMRRRRSAATARLSPARRRLSEQLAG